MLATDAGIGLRLVHKTWIELNWTELVDAVRSTWRVHLSLASASWRCFESIGCRKTRSVSARLVLGTRRPIQCGCSHWSLQTQFCSTVRELESSPVQFMCCEQAFRRGDCGYYPGGDQITIPQGWSLLPPSRKNYRPKGQDRGGEMDYIKTLTVISVGYVLSFTRSPRLPNRSFSSVIARKVALPGTSKTTSTNELWWNLRTGA